MTGRDKMWKLIRARRKFTTLDLVILAGVSKSSAKNYTRKLASAGFLRPAGRAGARTIWLLIKNIGPSRPILSGKQETK